MNTYLLNIYTILYISYILGVIIYDKCEPLHNQKPATTRRKQGKKLKKGTAAQHTLSTTATQPKQPATDIYDIYDIYDVRDIYDIYDILYAFWALS